MPLPESFWEEDPQPVPRFFGDNWRTPIWALPAQWSEEEVTLYAKTDAEAVRMLHDTLDDTPRRRRRYR